MFVAGERRPLLSWREQHRSQPHGGTAPGLSPMGTGLRKGAPRKPWQPHSVLEPLSTNESRHRSAADQRIEASSAAVALRCCEFYPECRGSPTQPHSRPRPNPSRATPAR